MAAESLACSFFMFLPLPQNRRILTAVCYIEVFVIANNFFGLSSTIKRCRSFTWPKYWLNLKMRNSETGQCSTSDLLSAWNINLCLEASSAVNSWLYNVYIQCMDKYDCLIYCFIPNNVLLDGRIITPFTIGLEQTTMKAAKSTLNEQHYKSWASGNSGQTVQFEKVCKLFLKKMFVYVLLWYVEQALVLVLR